MTLLLVTAIERLKGIPEGVHCIIPVQTKTAILNDIHALFVM